MINNSRCIKNEEIMIYTLKNEFITIKVNSLGSELISAIDFDGNEYIYQPSQLWIGQANNLFPMLAISGMGIL